MKIWQNYKNKLLPILQEYRDDNFPNEIYNTETFYNYLNSLHKDSDYIHKTVLDLIWEKPIKEDLDNLLKENLKHEYDRLIDILSNSNSFEEANKLAKILWDN